MSSVKSSINLRWVLDTGIFVHAEQGSGPACQKDCLEIIMKIFEKQAVIVIDNSYQVLGEYRNNLREGSTVWRLLNELEKKSLRYFHRLSLIECLKPERARAGVWFASIPIDLHPAHPYMLFDPGDRKFLALAFAAMESNAEIHIYSTDSDWCALQSQLAKDSLAFHDTCHICPRC